MPSLWEILKAEVQVPEVGACAQKDNGTAKEDCPKMPWQSVKRALAWSKL